MYINSERELEREHYGYWVTIPTRWMDNDLYGHVNNVTYYSYFDTAANQFLVNEGGLDIQQGDVVGFVVASGCQYKQPIAFPDHLDVGVRVNRLGTTSVEYGLGIFKRGEPSAAAFGHFTHVFVSRASGRPSTMPVSVREALESLAAKDVQG